MAQFELLMAGEQDGYVLEKRFIRKDGQAVWCTLAAQCVRRASDVLAGIRRLLRRSEAQQGPVDLHAAMCEVVRMLEPEARTRGVRIQVEPRRGEVVTVSGDSVQLQQVILNLAMNSFDAMASVPAVQRCLRTAVEVEGPRAVRVDVSDAGHGVAGLECERIFEAFHTTKPNGMGLGLPISPSIVEAHGGRLWWTPNPGGGETFNFLLPA